MDNETNQASGASGARPLWAPWRIQFVTSPKVKTCFLCDKGAAAATEDAANHVIARGRFIYVLLNDYPYNSGHLMLAPYRHLPDISDLTPEELQELMTLTIRAKAMMTRKMRPDGYNFGFNLGAVAGAGVPGHVHAHLVPRWLGDTNFMPVIGDTRVVPQALADTVAYLRQGWEETES